MAVTDTMTRELHEMPAIAVDVMPVMPDRVHSTESEWLIDVRGVCKKYCRDLRRSLWYGARDVLDAFTLRTPSASTLREFEFWAVDDVSFQLRRGDSLGLLGRNGAGKSTLLKLITGQRSLSCGTVATRGRIVALTELGLGFNPVLTGRENAYVNAAVYGYSRREFDKIIDDIIDFSEIREFIDSAVQTYSSGMKARLGFSVATHLDPDILVVDEVLAVGDLEFRRKCVRHILSFLRSGGSVILVAHDPYLVQAMCNRCIVLDRGKTVFDGSGIDGVNFHFELGRERQYGSIADAAERVMGDTVDQANAEAAAADSNETETNPLPEGKVVEVDHFEVLGEHGDTLRAGRPAKVLLHYRSNMSGEISWGFTVSSMDLQTNIFSCASGLDGQSVAAVRGSGTLVCHLRDFPLQPGVYAVRGGVGDAESLVAWSLKGFENAPDFFTVAASEATRLANYQMVHKDLISTKVEWN